MKLKTYCPKCSKPTSLKSELFGFKTLTCGCLVSDFSVSPSIEFDEDSFKSLDGSLEAYPYQKEAVEFYYKTPSGASRKQRRILIGDDTGLGKTVESLIALREDLEGNCPALICVRPSTFAQWFRQIKSWFAPDMLGCYPVNGTLLLPGFQIYLVSMDSLRTLVDYPTEEKPTPSGEVEMKPLFAESVKVIGGFKTIIFDECHTLKDSSSARTRAALTIMGQAGCAPSAPIQEDTIDIGSIPLAPLSEPASRLGTDPLRVGDLTTIRQLSFFDKDTNKQKQVLVLDKPPAAPIPNVILMSATAIKNRADEYFTALNILAPEIFPSLSQFQHTWLDYSGKFIKSHMLSAFKNLTKNFIIRRMKEEVLPDLPILRRDFTFITISDERIKKLYNDELKKMRETMENGGPGPSQATSLHLMTLRKIIGVAKAMFTVDMIAADPESLPDKYCIGIHHYDASSVLFQSLKPLNPLIYDGQTSKDFKDKVIQEFINRKRALLIISMSAGGVGVDGLQCCSEVLGVERMWSSADESQFEGRFVRIGSTSSKVRVEYLVVEKTIDTFFHQLVAEKRQIFANVIEGRDVLGNKDFVKEAAMWALEHKL